MNSWTDYVCSSLPQKCNVVDCYPDSVVFKYENRLYRYAIDNILEISRDLSEFDRWANSVSKTLNDVYVNDIGYYLR